MSSIHQVAKEARVSTATVSRTFSTPDLLSQQTRRRVLEVADRLNYRPRRAQPGKTGKGGGPNGPETQDALGFLFFASNFSVSPINDFYAPILSGAQAEAARLGMHLLVCTVPRFERPPEIPKMFRDQAVAGTLLVGPALPDVLEAYAAHLPPSILVDNRDEAGRHDSLLSDGFDGAYRSAVHLITLGHRRIGFMLDEPTARSFRDRRRGYLCAHWEGGLTPDPRLIVCGARGHDVEERLATVLRGPDRPTALLAANDMNAFAAIKVCRDLGLRIPEDVSLIGFDDLPFSVHTYPPLTTVRVDTHAMGCQAVRLLHSRLQEGRDPTIGPGASVHLTVPVSLVERGTCCPPG